MKNEIIQIQGMTNQTDVERVETSIRDVWGIRQVQVNLSRGEAAVTFDEQAASLHDFEQAIIDAGFRLEGK